LEVISSTRFLKSLLMRTTSCVSSGTTCPRRIDDSREDVLRACHDEHLSAQVLALPPSWKFKSRSPTHSGVRQPIFDETQIDQRFTAPTSDGSVGGGIRLLRWACRPDRVPGVPATYGTRPFRISDGQFKQIEVEILRKNHKNCHLILLWRGLPVC